MTPREPLRPVLYDDAADAVRLLDQRLLPDEERWLVLGSAEEVVDAIRTLAVRGAPAAPAPEGPAPHPAQRGTVNPPASA